MWSGAKTSKVKALREGEGYLTQPMLSQEGSRREGKSKLNVWLQVGRASLVAQTGEVVSNVVREEAGKRDWIESRCAPKHQVSCSSSVGKKNPSFLVQNHLAFRVFVQGSKNVRALWRESHTGIIRCKSKFSGHQVRIFDCKQQKLSLVGLRKKEFTGKMLGVNVNAGKPGWEKTRVKLSGQSPS